MANKKTGKAAPAQAATKLENGFEDAVSGAVADITGAGMFGGLNPVNNRDTMRLNIRGNLVSNDRQLLTHAYAEQGLIQTFIDVVVDDAFRDGLVIQSKQLSPENITELETVLERENDINHLAQAVKWARLFGGGAIIPVTNQDPSQPLNIAALKQGDPLAFLDADLWELVSSTGAAETEAKPMRPTGEGVFEHYQYYDVRLHKSRVIRIVGRRAPSMVRAQLRGWGLSEAEIVVNAINLFLKSKNLTFEILDEFKLDIFKIKGMTAALLAKDGTAKIQRRIQVANKQKNYLNALTMDAEDDYEQKQLNFSGIADIMREFRNDMSSVTRIPQTKLFGLSAAGFSSGEEDIENYNSMVESSVRTKVKRDVLRMVEMRCQTVFGMIPSDLKVSFKPLRVLGEVQKESVKTSKLTRLNMAQSIGMVSTTEYKEAVNKDELLPVKLDVNLEQLETAAASFGGNQEDDGEEQEGGEEGAGEE